LAKVLRAVRLVRGVKEIENQFEIQTTQTNAPSLQAQPTPLEV
jgi:hypothetical protein